MFFGRLPALAALLLAVSVLMAAFAGTATAVKPDGKAPNRIVLSPHPGQRVADTKLWLVVRAGPNWGDLGARLNGVQVGRDFAVGRHGRRLLRVSPSHGLRRGRNVLKVVVRRGGHRRHAKVVFDVVGRQPLIGAGRDRRVLLGSRIRLHGEVHPDRSDSGTRSLHWRLIGAPRKSAFNDPVPKGAARAAISESPSAPATESPSVPAAEPPSAPATLTPSFAPDVPVVPATLTPSFTPDVPGQYTFQLVGESANGTSSDTTTVNVAPKSLLVPVDTAAATGSGVPLPAIKVGAGTYAAPWMGASQEGGQYSGSGYQAMWQVVALERTTLALKSNRTYGTCLSPSGENYVCMSNGSELPVRANPEAELQALGPGTLVIAASHPSLSEAQRQWAAPNTEEFASRYLTAIGFPSTKEAAATAEINAAQAGGAAVIGVPGQPAGTAKFAIRPDGQGMSGYLTPVDLIAPPDYGFIDPRRPEFDTRSQQSCSNGTCTTVQTISEWSQTQQTTSFGGYMVSAFDRHTLAPQEHAFFVTVGSPPEGRDVLLEAQAMTNFLKKWGSGGSLIAITSVHGPSQTERGLVSPQMPVDVWSELTGAVAAIGGTRNEFNLSAYNPNSDYSLVGWGGAKEGEGLESRGEGRVTGPLAPNSESLYEPVGVSGSNASADKLAQILVAPPTTSWPLEANQETAAAVSYIGTKAGLGASPRSAYVTNILTLSEAEAARTSVVGVSYPSSWPGGGKPPFTEPLFTEAQKRLAQELVWVGKVRNYLGLLAEPANVASKETWKEAKQLEEELEAQLKQLQEKSKIQFEFLTLIEAGLELAGIPTSSFQKLFQAAAVASEVAQTFYGYEYSGAPSGTGPIVTNQLAEKLEGQEQSNARSFIRMGDVIVNDPVKLEEVGTYAKCPPGACPPGYESFEYTIEQKVSAETAMRRAIDRTIYETLVPYAFPIWNTGLALDPAADHFSCNDDYDPFEGAPPLSQLKTLDVLDPAGRRSKFRSWLSVARSRLTYGYAPQRVLERMFGEVPDTNNPKEGGLGISPLHFMLNGIQVAEYIPSPTCYWNAPNNMEPEPGG